MTERIAIVGSGLIGRTLALSLIDCGHRVTLYDRDTDLGTASCGYTGAGMLSPIYELELAETPVYLLGKNAVDLWSEIIALTGEAVFLQKNGTIVVSHAQDKLQLQQFQNRVMRKLATINEDKDKIQSLDSQQIAEMEPELSAKFGQALFIANEGMVDNRQLMAALGKALKNRCDAWHVLTEAIPAPYGVSVDNQLTRYAMVFDCRGLRAQDAFPQLRGVRGELIDVHAPDVVLNRPIRFVHPRYSIYVAARENHRYLIGATSIESDDMKNITVQSALELLSAAFSIHSGFAEATIEDIRVNCRPALPNNLPLITHEPGLMRINGLYRHGFLITPQLVKLAIDFMETKNIPEQFASLFKVNTQANIKKEVPSACSA